MAANKLLQGKVSIITGAAGGIGSAIAKLFAQHGAVLSLFDKDASSLQLVVDECNKISNGIKIRTFVGDITEEQYCRNVVDDTIKDFGRIDILINCAGVVKYGHVDDFNIDDYDNMMAVNLRSLLVLTSLAIPHLKQTQGNIVSVASLAAQQQYNAFSAYAVSKAGVVAYTKYAAAELGPFKVRVNCVSPTMIDTPMIRNPSLPAETAAMIIKESGMLHPLGRIGQPIDVAQVILFLASDSTAAFLTGNDIVIDGGYSVMMKLNPLFPKLYSN